MSKFDALKLDVDAPSRMTIHHPVTRQPVKDTDGNEAYIDLLSPDSEASRKFERKVTNERLAAARKSRSGTITAEQLEAEQANRLANMTAGWLMISFDGSPLDLEFTTANAQALYESRQMTWLRHQVEAHLDDVTNFTKASSSNS
jgi:hypothetical protein